MRTKVYGAPGTGKTETLKKFMMQALGYANFDLPLEHVVPPEKLSVVSFSNTAVNEFASRVGLRAKGSAGSRTRYFRTVHGLAEIVLLDSGLLDKEKAKIFSDRAQEHIKATFCRWYGIPYSRDPFSNLKGNVYFTELTRLINMYYPVLGEDIAEVHPDPKFVRSYFTWKKHKRLYDYNDLLTMVYDNRENLSIPVRTAIVDECQDLSPLQWAVLFSLFKEVEDFVFAGDDLQSIYTFAGSSAEIFLDLRADEEIVLERSYRLGVGTWAFSQEFATTLKKKKIKAYVPDHEEGNVYFKDYRYCLRKAISYATKHKRVFILTRTNTVAVRVMKDLINDYKVLPSTVKDPPVFLERLSKAYDVYFGFSNSRVKLLEREIETLVELIKSKKDLRKYLFVDTVHAVKGMEADLVVLVNSLHTSAIRMESDDEKRAFYVGSTRSRYDLYITEIKRYPFWFDREDLERVLERSKSWREALKPKNL
ncbi:MAG TPA: hypothetical protein ENF25_02730 [Thermoprotei archaeon]|nr:hypothetical protein [Thermoprotei archaeon]